jgi:hypothetical protein
MLTADEQPVRLYEDFANDLWRRARKGTEAGAVLRAVLDRSSITLAARRKLSSRAI